jgi:uncharacterized RDD family membrane protein YckC
MSGPAPDAPPEYLLPQSVIPRAAAYLIDSFIAALITMALAAAGVVDGMTLERFDEAAFRELLQSNSGITITIILFVYFLLFEGIWGRTPGKLALGLRVVRVQDGSPCGWSRSFIRNCIRPFDLLFLGLPGGLVVLMTPARQRLGDLLGGTLVVRTLRVPVEMAAVIPRLLRRCPDCGRLAGASAACPGCSAPPPVTPEAARRQFGAAAMQPFAGMMAAGEAAAALRAAAQATLTAEAAYAEASAAESSRLGEERAGEDRFVHTDDAPDLSDDYVAAWRGLMQAVDTLRTRRADLGAKLALAKVPLGQVLASDPVLRGLLDEVEPYLDADDDEAVLAAFMARTSAAASTTPADAPPPPAAPPAP